jgi:hypothetical protein
MNKQTLSIDIEYTRMGRLLFMFLGRNRTREAFVFELFKRHPLWVGLSAYKRDGIELYLAYTPNMDYSGRSAITMAFQWDNTKKGVFHWSKINFRWQEFLNDQRIR